jgi:hypothetical protein
MGGPRRGSLAILGMLAILTAGAAALSLASAPPLAEQQLRIGAGATAGVGSFVMDVNSVVRGAARSSGPAQVEHSSFRLVYQAPDRIQEIQVGQNGATNEIVIVGNGQYERVGGHWTSVTGSPIGSLSIGRSIAETFVLVPSTAASKAEDVVRHGQTSSSRYSYDLSGAKLAALFAALYRVPVSQTTGHAFGAGVQSEYMTTQTFFAAATGSSDTVTIHYSRLGTAPKVVPPPASALRSVG